MDNFVSLKAYCVPFIRISYIYRWQRVKSSSVNYSGFPFIITSDRSECMESLPRPCYVIHKLRIESTNSVILVDHSVVHRYSAVWSDHFHSSVSNPYSLIFPKVTLKRFNSST